MSPLELEFNRRQFGIIGVGGVGRGAVLCDIYQFDAIYIKDHDEYFSI